MAVIRKKGCNMTPGFFLFMGATCKYVTPSKYINKTEEANNALYGSSLVTFTVKNMVLYAPFNSR